MSSSKSKAKKQADDDLLSLVSKIKQNVGVPATKPSGDATSSSSKSVKESKPSSEKRSSKADDRDKELSKKEKKQRSEKMDVVEDSDDVKAPELLSAKENKKKRSRDQIADSTEADKEHTSPAKKSTPAEDAWDDSFAKDDIEDIFSGLKKTKEAKAKAEQEQQAEEKALKKLLERASSRSSNQSAATGGAKKDPNRRYTADGLPIYTEKELGLSTEGGDTALCPFDCDCCH